MPTRIAHLNCMSFCPPGRRLMDGRRGAKGPAMLSCHCLVLELGERLVLVDTGYGVQDVRHPRARLSPLFLDVLCRPRLYEEATALRQIEKLGYRAEDVSDIVLTHLDFDHAGGLDDFPRARVHMLATEKAAAMAQRTWLDRARFRPMQWQSSLERWRTYSPTGERWFGFEAARGLEGLPPEILLVPLIGHTHGHAGVAIRRDVGTWMLHTGDAYFYRGEMDVGRPHSTPGLRFYQWFMEVDREKRLMNQDRLRELVRSHGRDVQVFCAHDIVELERMKRISATAPVTAAERGVVQPHLRPGVA